MYEIYQMSSCILHPSYFISSWWLQSTKISSKNSVLVPVAHAFISMLDHAPMFILLVHARSFICQKQKYIYVRQHHIHMNIRNIIKKRKYLIILLACASSSSRSNVCSSMGYGCNCGSHVLITRPQ